MNINKPLFLLWIFVIFATHPQIPLCAQKMEDFNEPRKTLGCENSANRFSNQLYPANSGKCSFPQTCV